MVKTTEVMLSLTTIERLLSAQTWPCVSIVVPLEKGKWDERQARLELKNMVAHARDVLSAKRHSLETDALLAPAEAFLEPTANWSSFVEGLGLFLSPDVSVAIQLRAPAGPLVTVADRFDVLPLLPQVIPDFGFSVLTLSQQHVKLFRGTRYTFEQVHHPDLPDGLEDALWFENHESNLVTRGGPRQGSGPRAASVVHGGQTWTDEKRDMFERYVKLVDTVVEPIVRDTSDLLVLAAVEREVASYRAASHAILASGAVLGNPDRLNNHELHHQAWAIVSSELQEARQRRLLERFGDATGTNARSVDSDEIVDAAAAGRIETLLLPAVDVQPHSEVRIGGGVEMFVNEVVCNTLANAGAIVYVPASALPNETAVAALFRWEQPGE